jgi:hypothetical protein
MEKEPSAGAEPLAKAAVTEVESLEVTLMAS